ncbi:MAG: CreA family protein [Rhodospirillales bacterium]
MRLALFAAALMFALPALSQAEEIGSVGYQFKWIGPNDKIVVEAFDDPKVPGVACYLSRAEIGGLKGAVGLAENPSDVSIACRQVGPIDAQAVAKLKEKEEVFSARISAIFKTTQVVRFVDRKRNVLVYLTYSDRIIAGSPKNAVSVVPVARP